jgi:hypothetical protein
MGNYFGTSRDDNLDQTKLGLEDWSNLYGGDGDDIISIKVGRAQGDAGNDKITGLLALSTVMYGSSPRGVLVNLATGKAQDGFGTTDTLVNIRVVQGTKFGDKFIGSLENEIFWGLGGDDTIIGGGGSDEVIYWDTKRSEVKITYDFAKDTFTVSKDSASGDYGIDVLVGIDNISFAGPNNYLEKFTKSDLITGFPKSSVNEFTLSQGAFLHQLKGGDFNGDGNTDLLFVQQIGSGTEEADTHVFLGDGRGNFVESSAIVFSTYAKGVNGGGRTLVADFNKDGITDFFQLNFGTDSPPFPGGKNQLFLSSPATKKIEDLSSTLQQTTQLNHGGSIGDVNSDGYLDILVNSLGGGNFLLINDGRGRFIDRSSLIAPRSDTKQTNTSSGIIDLNLDGNPDIILGRWSDAPVQQRSHVLLNDGNANFNNIAPINLPLSGVQSEIILDVKAIDLNGDALPDLMLSVTNGGGPGNSTGYNTPYIQLLINNGNGIFRDETAERLPQNKSGTTHWLMSLTAVDFNNDGYFDILATSAGEISSTVYLNRGDGTFIKYWESISGGKSVAMDVDNDGMTDIVTADPYSTIIFNKNNLENNHIYKANFGGDNLLGSSISDKFYNGQGNDILNGRGGIDLLINPSIRSTYLISKTNTSFTQKDIRGNYGTDTLISIERIQFSDISLAIDLDGNAGIVAKILGSVAGRESLTNKEYVGIGLDLLDKGMSYSDLAALALQAVGLNTNDQIVTALWTNVLGSAPSATDKAPFVEMLENGFSRGDLAKLAADTAENVANIGLVGLAQTGIEFVPVV